MKNYKEISSRYLMGQKKRTILTIIGIILSVALVTAIGTIMYSTQQGMIVEMEKNEGSYHAEFKNLNMDQVNTLSNHTMIDRYGIREDIGYAPIKESTENERYNYGIEMPYKYIEIESYDNASKDLIPLKLAGGRLPENSKEIAIEDWILKELDGDYELGDLIELEYGERIEEGKKDDRIIESYKKTGVGKYKIVGIIKPRFYWNYSLVTSGIIGPEKNLKEDSSYNMVIQLNDIKNAKNKINSISKDIKLKDSDNLIYNDRLLRLSTEGISETFNTSIMLLVIFVVLIIIVSTIAVIYNSFNISVVERIGQFGLLRSIGATPRQIRGIVYKEAAILSLIAIPIGLISGILSMKIVLMIIDKISSNTGIFEYMEIMVSPKIIITSIVLGIITVFLSATGPAKDAGQVSPLEAIRASDNIKENNIKKVGRSRLIRKIFGIEGEIAYKNLSRNRKRFLITTFSMTISIVLFIVFATFSDLTMTVGQMTLEERADFTIYGDIESPEILIKELKEIEDIEELYNIEMDNGSFLADRDKIGDKIWEEYFTIFNPEKYKDGSYIMENMNIMSIGDENLKYLEDEIISGKIDIDKMNRERGVFVVNASAYHLSGDGERAYTDNAFKFKKGDTIKLKTYISDNDIQPYEEKEYEEFKVLGILKQGIMNEKYNENGSINIITTEDIMKSLRLKNFEETDDTNIFVNLKKDGDRKQISNLLEKKSLENPQMQYIDMGEELEESRRFNSIMNIFLYGFVAIITIISIINIINTISTNIILRTKEIATIKAVGMSQRSVKKMVSLESLFYGIYASIFGSIIGSILSYILFRIFMGISMFEYRFAIKNLFIGSLAAIIISIISGIIPLRRINNKIIVESIKEDN